MLYQLCQKAYLHYMSNQEIHQVKLLSTYNHTNCVRKYLHYMSNQETHQGKLQSTEVSVLLNLQVSIK